MLKDLLNATFKTLCPNVFTTQTGRLHQQIPAGEEEGYYVAPDNGQVRITGHCEQLELRNNSSGQSFSFANASKELVYYKDASVFVRKGDQVFWRLSRNTEGQNTNLYFNYNIFGKF